MVTTLRYVSQNKNSFSLVSCLKNILDTIKTKKGFPNGKPFYISCLYLLKDFISCLQLDFSSHVCGPSYL